MAAMSGATEPPVVALIDRSLYAMSVGMHAVWLAERMGADLELLHVCDPDLNGAARGHGLLADLAAYLADHGVSTPVQRVIEGGLADAVAQSAASLFVMGKRGADSQDDRQVLGGQVDAVLRATSAPVCLASQVVLPITRALVVTDGDPQHRAALDFVADHKGLADLPLEVLVAARPTDDKDKKLALARQALGGRAKAFAITAERPGAAVWNYLETRQTDLIVISRTVLGLDGGGPLRAITPAGLWNARTPVLVC